MMNRRQFIGAAALTTLAAGTARAQNKLANADPRTRAFRQEIQRIEAASGGRLGVAVLDTHDDMTYRHRGDDRFPMCSTFKMLAAAHVLARVDAGQEQLDRRVQVRTADLLNHAPRTTPRAEGEPMTMAELCDAAVTQSDNTAANLILVSLGGPAGLTAWLRDLGDPTTRLDRNEPTLNTAVRGDPRDTTTPAAMLATMQKLVLGNGLSSASRAQLVQWLVNNETGDNRLRAGVPAGWRVGDKTGTGVNGTSNDVGVIWPAGRGPVLVTAYLTQSKAPPEMRERALADVGRLAASLVTGKVG